MLVYNKTMARLVLMLTMSLFQAVTWAIKNEIRIGHLSGYKDVPKTGAAISMAIEKFQSEGRLLNYTFPIKYRMTDCEPEQGVEAALKLIIDDEVDVVFGPFCSRVCIPAGYILRYYDILHMPSSCSSLELNNKKIFNTLVRSSPGNDNLGNVIVQFLRQYGWSRVTIWNQECCHCQYGADSMELAFSKVNITVGERIREDLEYDDLLQESLIIEGLKRVRDRGRIILLCFNEKDMVNIMEKAADLNMVGSDYVYVWYDTRASVYNVRPWAEYEDTLPKEQFNYLRKAFEAMKQVRYAAVGVEKQRSFEDELFARLALPPWNFPNQNDVSTAAMNLHDSVYLYMTVLEDTLRNTENYSDGFTMAQKFKGRIIEGVTGTVMIGSDLDRIPEYVISQYIEGDSEFTNYGKIFLGSEAGKILDEDIPPVWRTIDSLPPQDLPPCGLEDELCPKQNQTIIITISIISIGIVLLFVTIGTLRFLGKRMLEKELQLMLWRISYNELEFRAAYPGSIAGLSMRSLGQVDQADNADPADQDVFRYAFYRGQKVTVRQYTKSAVLLNRKDLLELKLMKELNHKNMHKFVGACVEPPYICAVSVHCAKGSLQDVLENDDIKLDWIFKSSFITDLVNALCFIHESPFVSHGTVKSSNCLIDGRWVLKLTDYGLLPFKMRRDEPQSAYERCRELLWTAPELLRQRDRPPYGSQAGDVYSFGIVLQEIIFRALPFFYGIMGPQEIIEKVQEGCEPPYRPEVSSLNAGETDADLLDLMKSCWNEAPNLRPTMREARRAMRKINGGQRMDIVDVMIDKLEKYATNLEDIVTNRTTELYEEKRKNDMMLYKMLPRPVAEKLKKGKPVEAELYDNVTIFFSDIVGFTNMASESTPIQMVDLLNDLYNLFDDVITKHEVYKVETIGDVYMVVCGLPDPDPHHAAKIANMALQLLSESLTYEIRHIPGRKLLIRIGIHSGSCAAGLVGHSMPRYCLFGDTVNIASRMETTGQPMKIQLSKAARDSLVSYSGYIVAPRELVDVKGKEPSQTFWLLGKQDSSTDLTY